MAVNANCGGSKGSLLVYQKHLSATGKGIVENTESKPEFQSYHKHLFMVQYRVEIMG
jgi:hypothetical protein